ncbi:MAG: hydrogenase maturation protease [Nitrospira sp.]|nr:hydrogenase maturation protease [Nitrospira sp.]
MRVVVIGIGNLLCSDDGVGLHIVEALRKENLGDNVDLREVLNSLDILDIIKGYDRLIVVDAIKSGAESGTIYELSLEDIKDKQTVHSFSTHLNMDFPSILELGKKLLQEKIPEDIIIVAVEVEDVTTISDKCTPKVEKAIPEVVEFIKGLL